MCFQRSFKTSFFTFGLLRLLINSLFGHFQNRYLIEFLDYRLLTIYIENKLFRKEQYSVI